MSANMVTANQVANRIARLLQPGYFTVATGATGKKYGGNVTLDQAPEWLELNAQFGVVWKIYQRGDMDLYWAELLDLDELASKCVRVALGLAIKACAQAELDYAIKTYGWSTETWWHPSLAIFRRLLPNYRSLSASPTTEESGAGLPPPDLKVLATTVSAPVSEMDFASDEAPASSDGAVGLTVPTPSANWPPAPGSSNVAKTRLKGDTMNQKVRKCKIAVGCIALIAALTWCYLDFEGFAWSAWAVDWALPGHNTEAGAVARVLAILAIHAIVLSTLGAIGMTLIKRGIKRI